MKHCELQKNFATEGTSQTTEKKKGGRPRKKPADKAATKAANNKRYYNSDAFKRRMNTATKLPPKSVEIPGKKRHPQKPLSYTVPVLVRVKKPVGTTAKDLITDYEVFMSKHFDVLLKARCMNDRAMTHFLLAMEKAAQKTYKEWGILAEYKQYQAALEQADNENE